MQNIPAVLTALRNATSELHREVERLVPLLEKDFDQGKFVRWLRIMHPFYKGLDDQINQPDFLKLIGWNYIPRSTLIERDLSMLEAGLPSLDDFPPPLLKKLDTNYKRIGSLYVVEGSSLGGQILQKALSRSVPMVEQHGSAFLSPHKDATKAHWVQFIECLGSFGNEQHSSDEIIDGASMTFSAMSGWIRGQWHD